jgi:hypothetical protein
MILNGQAETHFPLETILELVRAEAMTPEQSRRIIDESLNMPQGIVRLSHTLPDDLMRKLADQMNGEPKGER